MLDSSLRKETQPLNQSISSEEDEIIQFDAEKLNLIKTKKNSLIKDYPAHTETINETKKNIKTCYPPKRLN